MTASVSGWRSSLSPARFVSTLFEFFKNHNFTKYENLKYFFDDGYVEIIINNCSALIFGQSD